MIAYLVTAVLVASYSAPLTRVHIDTDELHHTPQLVYVRDESAGAVPLTLEGQGLQYILQIDRAAGFGAQLSTLIGRASVEIVDRDREFGGILYGGQARLYAELLSGGGWGRPHALTVFANFRAVRYSGSGDRDTSSAAQTQLSSGVGFMAELAFGPYVSVLPYAWFSPSLYRHKRAEALGLGREESNQGASLSRPLRVGFDVWIYPFGSASSTHVSASLIASLIDTSGSGAQETAVVLGYTF
ncbi:MAG: hypothetical protein ACAI38_06965 [Myxococcota bacterium]